MTTNVNDYLAPLMSRQNRILAVFNTVVQNGLIHNLIGSLILKVAYTHNPKNVIETQINVIETQVKVIETYYQKASHTKRQAMR